MRILFITYTHSNGGGAEAVLTTLVNHLPNNWHIDILETLDFSRKKELINDNIHLFPALTRPSSEYIERMVRYMFFFHPKVMKALRGLYHYDVVISWMYRDASFMLPAFPECKRIAWFHGMVDDLLPSSANDIKNYLYKIELFRLQKKACLCADRIVEISNKTKESVQRVLPEFSNKVEVVYNGVDIEQIVQYSNQKIEDNNVRQIYEKLLTTGWPILISIGRIEHNKNFSLALNALSVLKHKNIFAYYLLVGKGDKDEELKLEKLVNELDISDRVFFMGFQNNPIALLKECKLLLVTSLEEGFSMVTAEAMTLGIPFVTTPVAGAGEELCNNETCGLVSDWNAEEYAEKIELLLKDEVLYKKMSLSCKTHVQNFSVASAVASFNMMIGRISRSNEKEKIIGMRWALIQFIIYIVWGYIRKKYKNINYRLCLIRQHASFLNICKLIYRVGFFFLNLLCLPLILGYSVLLTIKYKNRLFGYE